MHLESFYFLGLNFGTFYFFGFEFRVVLFFWVVEICSRTSIPVEEMLVCPPGFLVVQRSTITMYKIYNELFGKTRAEFISHLSESCDVTELRYVREMLYTVIKRRTSSNQLGLLVERKSGENLKDKIVKDIYNLYCFGEGPLSSLPKQMMKSDSRFVSQEVQTDSVSSRSMFATKSELVDLKAELPEKISRIKDNVLAELTVPKSADSLRDAQQPNLTFTNYSEPSSQPVPH